MLFVECADFSPLCSWRLNVAYGENFSRERVRQVAAEQSGGDHRTPRRCSFDPDLLFIELAAFAIEIEFVMERFETDAQ